MMEGDLRRARVKPAYVIGPEDAVEPEVSAADFDVVHEALHLVVL